jgi:hypothetical protein
LRDRVIANNFHIPQTPLADYFMFVTWVDSRRW